MMLNHFRLDKIAEKKNASLEVHEAHPVITWTRLSGAPTAARAAWMILK